MKMSRLGTRKAIRITRQDFSRLALNAEKNLPGFDEDGKKEERRENDEVKLAWPERRQKSAAPTPESVEAQLEAEHFLARARLMQLEQEDEVKTANKIILATKCQAIRDAQKAERERILKELKLEEERLDKMMEEERLKAIQTQSKQKERVHIQRHKYVQSLVSQIEQNKSKIRQESKKLREMHQRLEAEEEEAKSKRMEEQLKIRHELNQMNDEIKYRHQMEKAEEKMADLRTQQYMQAKAAREAERLEKKRRAKLAQEMEIARLRACQVRQQEVRAREESEAVEREQERVARAWRAKELESTKKRVKLEKDLREARARQAEEKKRQRTLELERETRDVKMLLASIDEDRSKQQEERIKHEENMLKYRQSLHAQIAEKQKRMLQLKEQKQQEAKESLDRQMARKADLQGMFNLKMKELRSHKVPEKYIYGVEKQLKLK